MTLTGFSVPYSNVSKVLQPYSPSFNLFIYPPLLLVLSPPTSALPLTWLCYIPVLHCLGICSLFSGVSLWNLPIDIMYFNQSIPLYYSSSPWIVQQFLVCLIVSCPYTDSLYHSLSVFLTFIHTGTHPLTVHSALPTSVRHQNPQVFQVVEFSISTSKNLFQIND
jgi:hypothetical protein